jgi:hypothetical protein
MDTLRVWVDITQASDVVFFAPIARRLENLGHTVTLTARRFESADLLLRRYGFAAMLSGRHRGGGLGARAVGLANRTRQLLHSAGDRRFDVATGSHTSDFLLAGWTLGIPQLTFVEEDDLRHGAATLMHLADHVAIPDALMSGASGSKLVGCGNVIGYPGFREEYYLHDVHPDPSALQRLSVDRRHVVGVVRPPRPVRGRHGAAPAPGEAELAGLIRTISSRRNVTLVLLARDHEQRERLMAVGGRGLVAPEGMADGIGLLAAADFILAGGSVMTREAAAVGTAAYVVTGRKALGQIERSLVSAGRLTIVSGPDDIILRKKDRLSASLEPRDPQRFVNELLVLARRRPRRTRLPR